MLGVHAAAPLPQPPDGQVARHQQILVKIAQLLEHCTRGLHVESKQRQTAATPIEGHGRQSLHIPLRQMQTTSKTLAIVGKQAHGLLR
eukprot:6306191-Pyramimonas_sp.AAC.1